MAKSFAIINIINKDINKKEEKSSEVLLLFLIFPQKYLEFRVLADTESD